MVGLLWQSSKDSMFTMQGAKVQFLVGEIRTVAEKPLNITGS